MLFIATKPGPSRRKLLLIIGGSLLIVGTTLVAISPIADILDKARFTSLESRSNRLYQDLVTASNGHDKWHYETSCDETLSGDWPTGEFTCGTDIFTVKSISSMAELNDLQTRYFSIIDHSSFLKSKLPIVKTPSEFGKNFVISSAEKEYDSETGDFECIYTLTLQQTEDDGQNFRYGSPIADGVGVAKLNFACNGSARKAWYHLN